MWSLPGLISFSQPDSAGQNLSPSNSPIRTISNHSAAISSIAVGHSSNRINIAISTSKDQTAIVWEYRTGKILRTFLLPATPRCVTIDPADRAFYVGYEDGSTQLVDFFKKPSVQNVLHDSSQQHTPSQLSAADRWLPPSPELGAVESITLSYDATSLFSGHHGGAVVCWDIAKGRFASTITTFNYPVTNLQMLPPIGLPKAGPRLVVHSIVKPRYDPAFLNAQVAGDAVPASYSFTAHLVSPPSITTSISVTDEFTAALTHQSFPFSLISEGLAELHALRTSPSTPSSNNHISLDEQSLSDAHPRLSALEQEVQSLKRQLATQESARHADMTEIVKLREHIAGLEDMNSDLLDQQELAQESKLKTRAEREQRALRRREAWFEAEKKGKKGDIVMRELEDADGDNVTSESDELSSEG